MKPTHLPLTTDRLILAGWHKVSMGQSDVYLAPGAWIELTYPVLEPAWARQRPTATLTTFVDGARRAEGLSMASAVAKLGRKLLHHDTTVTEWALGEAITRFQSPSPVVDHHRKKAQARNRSVLNGLCFGEQR